MCTNSWLLKVNGIRALSATLAVIAYIVCCVPATNYAYTDAERVGARGQFLLSLLGLISACIALIISMVVMFQVKRRLYQRCWQVTVALVDCVNCTNLIVVVVVLSIALIVWGALFADGICDHSWRNIQTSEGCVYMLDDCLADIRSSIEHNTVVEDVQDLTWQEIKSACSRLYTCGTDGRGRDCIYQLPRLVMTSTCDETLDSGWSPPCFKEDSYCMVQSPWEETFKTVDKMESRKMMLQTVSHKIYDERFYNIEAWMRAPKALGIMFLSLSCVLSIVTFCITTIRAFLGGKEMFIDVEEEEEEDEDDLDQQLLSYRDDSEASSYEYLDVPEYP